MIHGLNGMLAGLVLAQGGLALAQLAAAFFPRKESMGRPPKRGKTLLLIPAHNEGAHLANALAHHQRHLGPEVLGLVLCDNCDDDTVAVARNFSSFTVWERTSSSRPGKGAALQDVSRRLKNEFTDCDVIVVFDTDSRVQTGSPEDLATQCRMKHRPVQARTRLLPDERVPASALSALAWWWQNDVREAGRARLGLGAFLHGTGMAFPREDFLRLAEFSTSDVEDKTWTAELALGDRWTASAQNVLVVNGCRPGPAGWHTQRRRWELGHLREIVRLTPRLLRSALVTLSWRRLLFALDFSFPSLFLFGVVGTLRGVLVDDAFGKAFACLGAGFAALLFLLYRRQRPVPPFPFARAVAEWLPRKLSIALQSALLPWRRSDSLWEH